MADAEAKRFNALTQKDRKKAVESALLLGKITEKEVQELRKPRTNSNPPLGDSDKFEFKDKPLILSNDDHDRLEDLTTLVTRDDAWNKDELLPAISRVVKQANLNEGEVIVYGMERAPKTQTGTHTDVLGRSPAERIWDSLSLKQKSLVGVAEFALLHKLAHRVSKSEVPHEQLKFEFRITRLYKSLLFKRKFKVLARLTRFILDQGILSWHQLGEPTFASCELDPACTEGKWVLYNKLKS
jgi:hypothetical protein